MTIEEYMKHYNKILDNCGDMVSALRKQYVNENAMYKIGDIIENINTRIKISSFKITYSSFLDGYPPDIIYIGIELTKNNNPKKNKAQIAIYESPRTRLIRKGKVEKKC